MDSSASPSPAPATPPVPRKIPYTRSMHGIDVQDEYEWLRDKDNPEVIAHLEAENAYTDARTAHLKPLEDALFEEIRSRVRETDMSVPVRSGAWWYFSRTEEGKSYARMCRIPVTGGEGLASWTPPEIEPGVAAAGEEVFLDVNELAEGHEFHSLGAASVTVDGTRLAYSEDTEGDERFTVRIKDLGTGELLDDVITDTFYGVTWVGRDHLFYQRVDDAWRPHEIWRHRVGTPVEDDVLVFREDDERFWVGVGTTRSERYLLVSTASKTSSETWYLDLEADGPTGELTCIRPREAGVEYDVDHVVVDGADWWLVLHDDERDLPNGRLARCPVGPVADLRALEVMVPHRDDARVEGVDCFSDHIVLAVRENAVETLSVMDLTDGWGEFRTLDFGEELYSAGSAGNAEWDSPVLRVAYTSWVTPSQVWDIVLATGERILRREQEVLGDFDASRYTASRMWVEGHDGARIPASVIHRTDVDPAGPNPVLLYGYGSYEASMDPYFSVVRLSMLDRGVVYVVAHVRGGGEMGRRWYDHGKGLEKVNTFRDFISVADHLLDTGMTTRDRLVAEGGSAGGLLVGAVANMAGDRFAGIEAVVPFVDPLTSMLKPELPLTVTEWDEWGDPYHDPEVYRYMADYSPYENVDGRYHPPILAIGGLNDTRVLFVEPTKWVARLRERGAEGSGEVLLRTDMSSGHGGVSGRYGKWRQAAFETAWELDRMGATTLLQ